MNCVIYEETRQRISYWSNSYFTQTISHIDMVHAVIPLSLFDSLIFRPYFGVRWWRCTFTPVKMRKNHFSPAEFFITAKKKPLIFFCFYLQFIWFRAFRFSMRFKCFFTFSFSRITCVREYRDQVVIVPPSAASSLWVYPTEIFQRRLYAYFLFVSSSSEFIAYLF